MKRKVYISSTYRDLIQYREELRYLFLSEALSSDYTVFAMEGYVSDGRKAVLENCLEDVDNCDVYILILAERYGTIVPGHDKSFTEMEYDKAFSKWETESDFHILVFYSHPEIEERDFKNHEQIEKRNLKAFKEKVLARHSGYAEPFIDPVRLANQLLLALMHNFMRPKSLIDFAKVLPLINRDSHAHTFNKLRVNRRNSFYFISNKEQNPGDFLKRIRRYELSSNHKSCNLSLSELDAVHLDKFRFAFDSLLTKQLEQEHYLDLKFRERYTYIVSINIHIQRISSPKSLTYLKLLLNEFLPHFLFKEGRVNEKSIFILCFKYSGNKDLKRNKKGISQFGEFIKELNKGLENRIQLQSIDELGDVSIDDVQRWTDQWLEDKGLNEDDIRSKILKMPDDQYDFKMKIVRNRLNMWIDKEYTNQ